MARERRLAVYPALLTALPLCALLAAPAGSRPGGPPPPPAALAAGASTAGIPAAASRPPALTARAAVLIDLASGRVLFAQNENQRLYPASTTKILTALVALRRGDLGATVTVSRRAAATPGSTLGLRPGDRLTLRDLLYGMMLVSGNDAAEAVAQAVGGTTAGFVGLMNTTARGLGARSSHFANPSGLPDADHYTTAHDLALIARAALADPRFARIVATRAYAIHLASGRVLAIRNENRLLGTAGVDGVKTGWTTAAQHTYVASAHRGTWGLAAVVLRDTKQGKYDDALALLRYGFTAFRPYTALSPGQFAGQSQVMGGTGYYVNLTLPASGALTVPVRASDTVALAADNPEVVAAPVRAGAVLGHIRLLVDGTQLETRPLVATRSVGLRTAARTGTARAPPARVGRKYKP